MKQTETNPWTLVEKKYPEGTIIEGVVRNLTNYGAFVELEEGVDGLLHVSDMSWTRKVGHPSEVVEKGQTVRAIVLQVDQEKKRVALGLRQLSPDPWQDDIPRKFSIGTTVKGKVTKITNFGVFVELAADLEGLLHVSELSDTKVESPEEVVKPGQEIEVKVLRVDPTDRKIGLTMVDRAVGAPADAGEDLSRDRKPPKRKGSEEEAEEAAPARPAKKAEKPRDLPSAGDNALRRLASQASGEEGPGS
jgi:small subunit ribosomal protein S1